jgi:hypothetical protein
MSGGKTPENRCAESTTGTFGTTAIMGTHHLKSKHSLTCVTRQIAPARYRRCRVMPWAHPTYKKMADLSSY